MKTGENNKRIAKNSIYLYIRMFFVLVVTLFTTRILLSSLGVLDYGIYNIVGGIVSFMMFLQSAMANGFQRFFNISLGEGNKEGLLNTFSASIAVQIIISVIFLFFAETIGVWFLNSQLVIPEYRLYAANVVYQSAVFVFILTMIASPYNAIIIAYEKMHVFAIITMINVVLKLFIAYIAVIGSDRLILYSLLTILIQVLFTGSFIIAALKQNKQLNFKPLFDKKIISGLISFSGWNLFGSLAHSAKGQGLNIVLNMFFDPTINAARGVAYQVSAAVSQFFHNFQIASRPQIIKYYARGEYQDMLDLTYKVSKFSFMLLWIVDLPLLFTSDYFITLWLGEKMPDYAPIFTNIVLLTVTIECFSQPISTLVHATGQMRNFQVVTSMFIMLIIPIAYVLLKCGCAPEYALYCSLFFAPIVQLVRLMLVKKLVPLSILKYIKQVIWPSACVAVISFAFIFLFTKYIYVHSIGLAVICFLVSIISILLIGCSQTERLFLYRFICRKVKR